MLAKSGEQLTLEITPMIGSVFGETAGVAPGYNGSLSWCKSPSFQPRNLCYYETQICLPAL